MAAHVRDRALYLRLLLSIVAFIILNARAAAILDIRRNALALLEGSALRVQGGEEIAVKKGDFWRTPGNAPHTRRAEPKGARVLDIVSPPWPEYKRPGSGYGNS